MGGASAVIHDHRLISVTEEELDFGFNKEQQRFRQEVRDFCQKEPWGELVPEVCMAYSPSFYRRVAEKGWLGLRFPRKYGGQGKDAIYETIFLEEVGYSGAPVGWVLQSLAVSEFIPLVLKFGNELQKKEYLPRILKGEVTACHAFTEPEAGSDLSSVQTRAIREGDYYIVNGKKMFHTFAHVKSCYAVLMAKTDPSAPSGKGISLFILDNESPGISYNALRTLGAVRTNQVFFDDVKIPRENLLGEENKGWDYFTQIRDNYWVKGRACRLGLQQLLFDRLVQYTKETKSHGCLLSEDARVRQKLAEMAIDIRIMRLLLYRVAWMQDKGLDALTFAAILRVFMDESVVKIDNNAMQILGLCGQLQEGSKYVLLGGVMEGAYREDAACHFWDGGSCATRNTIATHALGLPEF